MKTLVLLLLCLCSRSIIYAQSASLVWAKAPDFETSTGGTEARNKLTAADPAGYVYVAGVLYGSVDFDPGPGTFILSSTASYRSAFVAKYDPQGALVWAKHIAGTDLVFPLGLALDARGSLFITGTFKDTVDFDPGAGVQRRTTADHFTYAGYVLKLDTTGAFAWVTTMDNASANPLFTGDASGDAITIDTAGNAYVVGDFSYLVRFGATVLQAAGGAPELASDIFVCKLSGTNGAVNWVVGFSGDAGYRAAYPAAIATDAGGNILITGNLDSVTNFKPVDFDPGAAKFELSPVGRSDLYVLKLKPDGSFGWAKSIGGRQYDYAKDLMPDVSSNVYIAGSFEDTVDFDPGPGISKVISAGQNDGCLIKLDSSGAFSWVKVFSGSGYQSAGLLTGDQAGNIYIGGSFDSTADLNPGAAAHNVVARGGSDAFLVKVDPAANFVWATTLGGSEDDYLYGMQLDAAGNIYVRGAFNDTGDFDPCPTVYPLIASDADHTFLLKLSQSPFNCPSAAVTAISSDNVLLLFPNPANENVTLSSTGNLNVAYIHLQNICGQTVQEWQKISGKTFRMDISSQSPGLYFVEVVAENGEVRRLRLTKQ